MSRQTVVDILMKRDGISEEEANSLIEDTASEILDCTNVLDADEILMDNLGLEPDYLLDILLDIL